MNNTDTNIEALVALYDLADRPSSHAKAEVDLITEMVAVYYMQSDQPLVAVDGGSAPISVLLNTNKKALTLKYIDYLLSLSWISTKQSKKIIAIRDMVLYADINKSPIDNMALKRNVCAYIKTIKSALHIKDLNGNPLALLSLPLFNPELYLKIVEESDALGFSLNELLSYAGVNITIPNVRETYQKTGEIIVAVGDQIYTFSEKTNTFVNRNSADALNAQTLSAF